jgi:hypothetical protein
MVALGKLRQKTSYPVNCRNMLRDRSGNLAGKFDIVLATHDDEGKVTDFGALEVQAVYISGNVRKPLKYYMKDPSKPWPVK